MRANWRGGLDDLSAEPGEAATHPVNNNSFEKAREDGERSSDGDGDVEAYDRPADVAWGSCEVEAVRPSRTREGRGEQGCAEDVGPRSRPSCMARCVRHPAEMDRVGRRTGRTRHSGAAATPNTVVRQITMIPLS